MKHRLGLEDHDADRHHCPGVLRDLIFVQALSEAQDGDHQQKGIKRKGHHHVLLENQSRSGVGRQKSGVAGHEVTDAARPGEKGCHKEPCPLDGTEEWQPLLSSLAFSDPDQFGEDETLQGEDQGAKVQMTQVDDATKRHHHTDTHYCTNGHLLHLHLGQQLLAAFVVLRHLPSFIAFLLAVRWVIRQVCVLLRGVPPEVRLGAIP
mmetsp:Transcript_12045/g.26611  ORF Transcript_12045/g.26611 Transcript_12045/m.26611 type:complete len:206 (-) Transcript_12045:126-743(-)